MTLQQTPVASFDDAVRAADWTFEDSGRQSEFHPYPARYIPAIPRQIIALAGLEMGTVLDPFCGSGTTLLEARRAGLEGMGSDINPIALLISKVRTLKLADRDIARVRQAAIEIRSLSSRASRVDSRVEDIPRVDHWFTLEAKRALSEAMLYVDTIDKPELREAVSCGISAATVRVSNQESDTRYAAIRKDRTQEAIARILSDSILKVAIYLERNRETLTGPEARVAERDARDQSWIPDASIDLACFSPPYPNAYEYWLYHKYRMYFLGFDPVSVRAAEIGARPHYVGVNGLTAEDFYAQMEELYLEMRRTLKTGAHAVAIVGDSIIRGTHVDNGELMRDAATSAGFITYEPLERQIMESRSSFNRAHSRARRTEHIVVVTNK